MRRPAPRAGRGQPSGRGGNLGDILIRVKIAEQDLVAVAVRVRVVPAAALGAVALGAARRTTHPRGRVPHPAVDDDAALPVLAAVLLQLRLAAEVVPAAAVGVVCVALLDVRPRALAEEAELLLLSRRGGRRIGVFDCFGHRRLYNRPVPAPSSCQLSPQKECTSQQDFQLTVPGEMDDEPTRPFLSFL